MGVLGGPRLDRPHEAACPGHDEAAHPVSGVRVRANEHGSRLGDQGAGGAASLSTPAPRAEPAAAPWRTPPTIKRVQRQSRARCAAHLDES